MEQVIYKNSAGKIVTLGDNTPFILTKVDGTGAVGTNIYTQKSPHQDGVSYQGNTLEPRPISLEVKILAENEVDMVNKRSQLLNVFNPKLEQGELTYRLGNITRKVSALPEIAPVFPESKESRDFKDTMQDCLIQLYCPNPHWQDINTTKAEIALWRGSFEFPLELVEEGIELGYREPSLIVNVLNRGDVATGMKIQFKALATVENPSLFNVNTREYFKINKTMEAGEIITVNTHFQNKRVELNKNGVISNAFNWIDFQSIFLQLDPGDNLFRYDADEGLDNLEVSIYFTPQYLGV